MFVEENLKHGHAGFQIRVVKFVSSVPAKGSKLSTLLNYRMEEREAEYEFSPLFWLLAIVKLGLAEINISTFKICLKTSGRFSSHLYTIL